MMYGYFYFLCRYAHLIYSSQSIHRELSPRRVPVQCSVGVLQITQLSCTVQCGARHGRAEAEAGLQLGGRGRHGHRGRGGGRSRRAAARVHGAARAGRVRGRGAGVARGRTLGQVRGDRGGGRQQVRTSKYFYAIKIFCSPRDGASRTSPPRGCRLCCT